MTEFKVGTQVRSRGVFSPGGREHVAPGTPGTIVESAPRPTSPYPWKVQFQDGQAPVWVLEEEIEPEPVDDALTATREAIARALDGQVSPGVENIPERSLVLREAEGLINGQRQVDYGPPSVNFTRIAHLWDVLVPRSKPWTPADVALALAGLKLARAAQGFQRDTAVDLAGYAAIWAELNKEDA